jgi:hypothetical protein
MSLFSQSNVNKFIAHTPLPLERINQELIGYPFEKQNHIELFRMRMKTQVCEMKTQVCEIKSFKLMSWLNHIELLLRLTWKKIQIFMFSMIVLLMLMQRS